MNPQRMQQTKTFFSVAEYLAMEAVSETKHEYWDGEIVAMAGASVAHARRVSRFIAALSSRLGDQCEAFASDLRVRTSETRYAYPDVSVVCGDLEVTDERPPALLNPAVVIEVLSDSTERFDRGRKMEAYTAIESVLEYWIVQPEEPRIVRYIRQEERWFMHIEGGIDTIIRSEHLGVELPLSEIYR